MKILIRAAEVSDVSDIYMTVKAAFATYKLLAGMKEQPLAMTETAEDILQDIKRYRVLCAICNGEFAGCVRLRLDGDGLYFYRFAVSPKYQQSGVGKELVLASEKIAREMGAKRIFLHTAENIEPLIKIYLRHGFEIKQVDEKKGYPRALMVKEIL